MGRVLRLQDGTRDVYRAEIKEADILRERHRFRGAELQQQWRLSTELERTADELAVLFAGLLEQADLSFSNEITGVVISSVVPSSTTAELFQRGSEPFVPRARKNSTRRWTSSSGALAPEVIPTVSTPSSHSLTTAIRSEASSIVRPWAVPSVIWFGVKFSGA